MWRNKACWIALPLDVELGRRTTRDSYLGEEDVARRLEGWKSRGYDTKGFVLATSLDSPHPFAEGQSRPVHPDPEDEKQERAHGRFRVNIPDRREWEAYVNRLKEEKLRLLGVTFGDEEPASRKSPAPSLMSRQVSSQSSAMILSPPSAPSLAHAGTLPPPIQVTTNNGSHVGKQGVSHFPRYSMATPFGDLNFTSPNQFPQAKSPVPETWSPQPYLTSQTGSRITSPIVNGNLQTLSPPAPPVQDSVGQASTQDYSELLARVRQQQSLLQAQNLQQQQQQQQQHVLQPYPLPSISNPPNQGESGLPRPYIGQPEIVSPIPRGHRQNPSESLQKELDEVESYREQLSIPGEILQDSVAAEEADDLQPGPILADYQRDLSQNDKTDGSDMETNPSVSGTPDVHVSQPNSSRRGHSSKAPVSKLNVNAPDFKFEPDNASGVFAFLGNQKPSQPSEIKVAPTLPSIFHSKQPSNEHPQTSKLNVEAPEFMPGGARKPKIPSREFSFSSSGPLLRPDALAFKPSDLEPVAGMNDSRKEHPVEAVKKIFGDIDFSEVIKPAKKSRAIPIMKPNEISESPEKSNQEVDGQEDESGRITQADGRQKRMRRDLDDGDQVPIFASPNHTPWRDHGTDDRAAYFSRTPSEASNKGDATTLEAATDLLEEMIDDLSATEASDLMRDDGSVDGDGKPWEAHAFQDIEEAASFNAALPPISSKEVETTGSDPTSDEVTRATRTFLGKSPQYRSQFSRALDRRTSGSQSSSPGSADQDNSQVDRNDQIDRIDHATQAAPAEPNIVTGVTYIEPSYEEIDAVMQHLNQEGSNLGIVERQPSPWKHRSPSISPIRSYIPAFPNTSRLQHILHPLHIRSDAPSPSPNRLREPIQYLPMTDSESADTAAIEMVARNARYSPSYRPSKTSPPIHRLNSPGSSPPSDWDDLVSSADGEKIRSKTGFFHKRVNSIGDLVEGIVQQRLNPLEKTLSGIQQSLAKLSSRSASRRPRSSGNLEIEHSDADDEDETEETSQSRMKSPLRDRKYDQLRSFLNEMVAAQQSFAPSGQLKEFMDAVKDLKASIEKAPQPPVLTPASVPLGDFKTIVEEVVGRQMRGRSGPVTSSSQAAAAEKSQLQITGLESMLKIADARAEDELKARRATEDALADNQRLLRMALQEAAEQRESAEETERSLQEYHEERQQSLQRAAMLEGSQESSQKLALDLSEKNAALEDTLAEYRLSSDQWRTEIDDARHENKDLRRNISSLSAEIEESVEGRRVLRAKFDRLQEDMAQASLDIASDQSRWRSKEEEHNSRLGTLSTRLEGETMIRERLELEIERLETQEKEAMKTHLVVEQTQKASNKLEGMAAELKSECYEHQKAAARFELELQDARETGRMEVQRTRTAMEADIDVAKGRANIVRADLESVIARLQNQIESVTADASKAQVRHELMLEEASESRSFALQEAADARDAALQEHYRFHERTLNEMKTQHERALNNVLEDNVRSETYFGNRLSLADEKVIHYQDRVTHLEERLEIAKSAAHAAVQAAQSKKPTPSPRSVRTSQPIAKAPEIPEKVSPQALRESILVLQEQLQAREIRIEELELELSVDAAAPVKLKDANIEITWLRELLGVRIDDLEDIIKTLSRPTYDREAVKDAAIRLKANLQMEQQEKERALAGGQTFPSLASISSLAASPKALPLAAAAAWGNWKRGRDNGFGNLSAIASESINQTPVKSSPQSFFAGLMTPPSTEMRSTPPFARSRPTSSSSSKSAVRAPTTPRQILSAREDSGPSRRQQDPVTPPLLRRGSYDLDASGIGVDGNKMTGRDEIDETFGPSLGGIVGGI